MRFSCSRASLGEVLSLLSDVVPTRSPKPVLQNIQIKGNEDGTVTLSATDLEIAISCRLQVADLKDPSILLLPAGKLTGIVRDEWAETLSFNLTEDKGEITSANGTFKLNGSGAEEFPSIHGIGETGCIELNGDDIQDAVNKTAFATSKGDARYALNGIYLVIEGNRAEFVSSDTHRLSLCGKDIRNPENVKAAAIVITKGMSELSKMSRGVETVKVQLTGHEMIAETPMATLVCRLVDGQFPRYRDVIPKELPKSISVVREHLVRTLRLAGQMTNEETKSVVLRSASGKLHVSATGNEAGEGLIEMEGETAGGDVTASYNFVYLLDMLKVIDAEKVTLNFVDGERPAKMEHGDFTHIIMPIKPRG